MRGRIFWFWSFTKTNLVMLAACFAFNPFNAFAITSKAQSIYDVQYKVNNSGDTTPILIMGCILFAVLFAYYKATSAGRHGSISIQCRQCGRTVRGLRCLICESKKQPQE